MNTNQSMHGSADMHGSAELTALYRSGRASVDGLDAETLLAYVDGGLSAERTAVVAELLERSPRARVLLALLVELQSDSSALADGVASERAGRHAIAQRANRRVAAAPVARSRRVAGWLGAIAASALAVIAIFAFHGSQQSSTHSVASDSAARGDQIFAMRDDRIFKPELGSLPRTTGSDGNDRLFDSSFTKGG